MSDQIHYNIEMQARSNGKTFRRLLAALIAASEGHDVLYLTGNAHMRQYYFDRAVNIVMANNGGARFAFRRETRTIRFPNKGSIRFVARKLEGVFVKEELTGANFKTVADD